MSVTTASSRLASNRTLPTARQQPAAWVRPSQWLSLPDVTGQQMFAGLFLISLDGNFVALSAAGDYTVNWGDGTTTNHSSGVTAYKQYDYDDIADTGEADLGYRQVVITVTPQAGQNLTSLSLQHRHNQTGLNTSYGPLWLEIDINGSNLTTLTIGGEIALSAMQRATIRSHAITSAASLFQNCTWLQSVPLFDTAAVTNMASMFRGCSVLKSVPPLNSSSALDMSDMFNGCNVLETVPYLDTSVATNLSGMFNNCGALVRVPLLNTSAATNMASMFANCVNLLELPHLNTANATNLSSFLINCLQLKSVPFFNTASAVNMSSMLSGLTLIQQIPPFNTSACTNISGFLNGCSSLLSVPLLDTSSATNLSLMLSACRSLTEIPLFNTSSATNMSQMLSNASSLVAIPPLDTSQCTNFFFFANFCRQLTSVPLLNTAAATNMSGMFNACSSLTSVPAMTAAAATTLGTVASGGNISWFDMTDLNATISFANQKLSKAALDHIFTNLLRRTTSTTITISGNYGADTAVSKTSCGRTSGSKVVTQSDTSNLQTGMRVLGTGVTDAVAVTFQDTGDTVTRTAHGLDNGTIVSFTSITSTTGILTYTRYYVVNATTNTFQLSDTEGGAAKALTTNGSGNMLYPAYITAITTNVSFEMSAPASSTGTGTLTARILDTYPAVSKGWSVSG